MGDDEDSKGVRGAMSPKKVFSNITSEPREPSGISTAD